MKKKALHFLTVCALFSACSKEKKCIKGKIIDGNPCVSSWGVQILEGPKIGTQYGSYENVIELFDVPYSTKSREAIIYFTYQEKKPQPDRPCIAVLPMPDFSSVEKSLATLSDAGCP